MEKNKDHALRGAMLVVKIAAGARYLVRHDQVAAAEEHVRLAYEGVSDMRRLYPDSPEFELALKAYNVVKREFEVASAKQFAEAGR